MKKILFITYYWPPSGGAGVQRALKFVKYLPQFGIEPVILSVDEKYASYPLTDATLSKDISVNTRVVRTKSFEVLKVLSLVTSKENIPHGGFANKNKEKPFQKLMRFIRGNFFIPDARKGWIRFALKEAGRIIESEKIDTVFITSPPHSSQLIGLELKKKYKIRWIADMRDPWTDIYYYKDLLHTKFSSNKDQRLEKNVLSNADEVISVSNSIREMFLNKIGSSVNKFHIIPNGFDENDFTENIKSVEGIFYITYVGSIADTYNPKVFFESVRKVVDEFRDVNIKMRFIGSMPASVRQLIGDNRLDTITEFIPTVSHDRAVGFMQESSVLLLLIPDVPKNEGILTGKLFEYLASRRPVIGLGPSKGDAAAIIDECEAGWMFDRNDSEKVYAYLKSLILRWHEEKSLTVMSEKYKKYSRRELTKQLAEIILKK